MVNKKMITKITCKVLLTVAFPLIMFLAMLIITSLNGINYYLSSNMLRQVSADTAMTTIIALAIYLQFKNGRFDFSGGATMILSVIFAGNITLAIGGGALIFMLLCVVFGVLLAVITANVYIFSKVPIIIITIAMALIYEAFTLVVFKGEGLSIISRTEMLTFARFPGIFIVLGISIALFVLYTYFTKPGRESKLLANNQKVAISIGISEKKNVLITYILYGILLGFGGMILSAQGAIKTQSNLSTASILFSYIVPVFIGMFLGKANIDAVGVIIAALGLELMNYGLDCLGVGAGGYQQIIFGVFMMAFYTFSAKFDDVIGFFKKFKSKKMEKLKNVQ